MVPAHPPTAIENPEASEPVMVDVSNVTSAVPELVTVTATGALAADAVARAPKSTGPGFGSVIVASGKARSNTETASSASAAP